MNAKYYDSHCLQPYIVVFSSTLAAWLCIKPKYVFMFHIF